MNDFNLIAPFYKSLGCLVFGDVLLKAQIYFLNQIPKGSKVLILGGGDGRLLSFLDASLKVDFVELSAKMLTLAKVQNYACEVNFVLGDESALSEPYGVIITPFVLDCFKEEKLQQVLQKLDQHLPQNGMWICTDFNADDRRLCSQLIVGLMIFFFRVVSQLQSNKLLNFFEMLGRKYTSKRIKYFKGSLIRSEVFIKI